MAKADDKPSSSADDDDDLRASRKQRRIDAQMLAALYSAEDAEIGRFRKVRLGRDCPIPDDRLLQARDVLERMVELLRGKQDGSWQALEDAFDDVAQDAAPVSPPPPTTASPSTQAVPPRTTPIQTLREDTDVGLADATLSIPAETPPTFEPPRPPSKPAPKPAPKTDPPRTARGTERPPGESGDDEGDRPTTPPAPPVEPSWATPAMRSESPPPSAAPPMATRTRAWMQRPPAQPPQPWGQAYAPGSLPQQPPMHAPPAPGSHPQMQPQPYHHQAHGPPSSQPLGEAYDPSFAPTQTREPTPPLFPKPSTDEAPGSEHTPAVGMILEEQPPDSRTDPHRALPPPPPPLRRAGKRKVAQTLPFRDDDHKTMELTLSSQAHCFALTVEEFAAHCAEREITGDDDRRRLNRRYDITDEDARAVLEQSFKLRFERDPSLRSRWEQAYVKYSTLLRQRMQREI